MEATQQSTIGGEAIGSTGNESIGSGGESLGGSQQGDDKSLKQQASGKLREVASQARTAAESGKDKLADGANQVAAALHHASEGLQSDEQAEIARYTNAIASKIEQLAEALKSRDLPALANDVKRLAERQPALFLGGAFTAGLIAARFLKSSASAAEQG